MKKKLIALCLMTLLGAGIPASAMPHQGGHGCSPKPAPVQHVAPHHEHHRCGHPAVGMTFSTGVLARRSCWYPYYGFDTMSLYYPPCIYHPSIFINLGF